MFVISKKVNTNIPFQAKANAILLAVHIDLNFSFCRCVIGSDCKVCIDAKKLVGLSSRGVHGSVRVGFVPNPQLTR